MSHVFFFCCFVFLSLFLFFVTFGLKSDEETALICCFYLVCLCVCVLFVWLSEAIWLGGFAFMTLSCRPTWAWGARIVSLNVCLDLAGCNRILIEISALLFIFFYFWLWGGGGVTWHRVTNEPIRHRNPYATFIIKYHTWLEMPSFRNQSLKMLIEFCPKKSTPTFSSTKKFR